MHDRDAFEQARHDLVFAHERKTSLAQPFLTALPVLGASVSVLSARIGPTTVSASDPTAARLDELQFDTGEGPCWQALATRRPVRQPDIRSRLEPSWPQFLHAFHADHISESVEAMFAFPLAIGVLEIGAVDLWADVPGDLTESNVRDASDLARLASWQVLRRVLGEVPELADQTETISSRREIHQATGMVLAQLDIAADDASLLVRAHAYASGKTVGATANDIVERRLVFTPDGSTGAGESTTADRREV